MPLERNTIVFAGGIFRDVTAYASAFPRPGETIFGHDFLASFGGKSANQSVACAILSKDDDDRCTKVAFVGAVGDDENGRAYRKNLAKYGVDTTGLIDLDGSHTGVATIFVDSTTGENQIVVVKGASDKVTERELQVTMVP